MTDAIDNEIAYEEQAQAFDVHDPDAVAEAEKSARRVKEKMFRVVEAIMSNEDGRAWMYEKLENCLVFTENTMRDTPERNAVFEGKRAIGLALLAEIMTAAPELFWKMRCESVERARK